MSSPCWASIRLATCGLEARRHVGDLAPRRDGHACGGHVEEDEVVVVGEAHHQLRGRPRRSVEELAHRGGRRLQHGVELFPPVNLLDLRVANEVQVEDDQLAALLELRANPVDRDRERRKPGERIVQHLLKLDALDAIGDPRIRRQPSAERRPDAGRDFVDRRRLVVPLLGAKLDGAAARGFILDGDDDGNADAVRVLGPQTQRRRILVVEQDHAHAGPCAWLGGRNFRQPFDAPTVQPCDCLRNRGVVRVGQEE